MFFKYFKKSVVTPSGDRKDPKDIEKQVYLSPVAMRPDSDSEWRIMQKAKKIDMRVMKSMPVIFALIFAVYFLIGFCG